MDVHDADNILGGINGTVEVTVPDSSPVRADDYPSPESSLGKCAYFLKALENSVNYHTTLQSPFSV